MILMDKETLGRLYSPVKLNKKFLAHPIKAMERIEQIHQEWVLLKERFIDQQYYWLIDGLKPNTTVIDLGANMGDSAIYFAQFPNAAKVIAFEPAPFAYHELLSNIKRCPLRYKIKAVNKAASNTIKELVVLPTRKNVIGFNAEHQEDSEGVMIKAISLSEILKGAKAPVVIKCDIEGGEETIFNCDMTKVYRVMLEWHGPKRRDAAVKSLKAQGFKTRIETNPPKTQGMIYARR